MEQRKIIYYEDELNDEFSTAVINPKPIDGSYKYLHKSPLKKLTHFFWYRVVATPIAFAFTKIKFRHKILGKEKLFGYRSVGYFMYGNHTQDIGDAFIPHMLNFPKTNYTIVHPNNVSMPILGKITPSLGALPLPDDMTAYKNFLRAIDTTIREGNGVVIYPEAHIWPYYTGIRPFPDTSFSYPVKLDVPCFCFTNTYQKRKHSKKPRIVTYIDGPFFQNKNLTAREQKAELRGRIYQTMCERARSSTVEKIKYIKKETNNG